MRVLRDLSVRGKLYGGFGLVLAFTLVLGVVLLSQLGAVNNGGVFPASTEQVSASTEQTSASAQEIAASAQQLAGNADTLNALMSQFTVGG